MSVSMLTDGRETTPCVVPPLSRAAERTGAVWRPNKKEWWVMYTLVVSSLVVALDATILVSVIPTLARSLHGTATVSFWVGTSYLLTSAVVQPLVAAVATVFGWRYPLLGSLGLFTVGSIVCGAARSFPPLLLGRVVQGLGGGGIIALAQVIYGDMVPLRQRPRYFAMVQGAWAVGTLLGPLVGAVFVQQATWRWCFYVNVPICSIAFLMATQTRDIVAAERTIRQKLSLVDWTGLACFVPSLTCALVAVSQAGQAWPWSSPQTLALLIVGVSGVGGTVVYETKLAPHPFLARAIFANSSVILSHLAALAQGAILFMALYYLCFYFAAAHLASPLRSGVDLLPAVALSLPSSVVVSTLITRWGRYRWAVWGGWAVTTSACGLLLLFDWHTLTTTWAPVLSALGMGLGMTLSAVNFATQAAVTCPAFAGRAAALYAFNRTMGMTIGVTIGGTIFQNRMRHQLRVLGLDEDIARDAEAFVYTTLRRWSDGDPSKGQVLTAYVYGFRAIFVTMTAISGVALLLTLPLRHFSLDSFVTGPRDPGRDGAEVEMKASV